MADEDPSKMASDSSRASRRKRPPVTIDLEAEPVPADAPVVEPPQPDDSAPFQATASIEPESELPDSAEPDYRPIEEHAVREPALPEPEARSSGAEAASGETIPEHLVGADPLPETIPPERRSARFLVPAIAAFGGAVAGGLLVAFLAAPAGTDPVAQATIDSRFDTLTAKLNTLESMDSQPAAATIDPKRIDAIEADIKALKQAPAPVSAMAAAAPASDLAPIENRIAALEAKPAPAAAAPVDLGPLTARLDQLSSKLADIEAHPPVDPKTEAAAKTIAITALRQTASGSAGFASELDAALALGTGDPSLTALAPLAATGAPSKSDLVAGFPSVADAIRTAAAKVDPGASLFDRLAASAGSLVSVKPAGPMPGSSTTAVLSRVEAAVKAGDLVGAVKEGAAFDSFARPAFIDWSDKATRRVTIDAALARLDASSSSN